MKAAVQDKVKRSPDGDGTPEEVMRRLLEYFEPRVAQLVTVVPCRHRVARRHAGGAPEELEVEEGQTVTVLGHLRTDLTRVWGCSETEQYGWLPVHALELEPCTDVWKAAPVDPGLVQAILDELEVTPVLYHGTLYGMTVSGERLLQFLAEKGQLPAEEAKKLLVQLIQCGTFAPAVVACQTLGELFDKARASSENPLQTFFKLQHLILNLPFSERKPYRIMLSGDSLSVSGIMAKASFRDKAQAISSNPNHFVDLRVIQILGGVSQVSHGRILARLESGPLKSPSSTECLRLMCFDGGGVRGYLQVLALNRMRKIWPDMLEKVWGFGGVSTGSITASWLAHEYALEPLDDSYQSFVQQVFTKFKRINPLSAARIDSNGLRDMSGQLFPSPASLLNKRLLILSTLLDNGAEGPDRSARAVIEDNFQLQRPPSDEIDEMSAKSRDESSRGDFVVANSVIASCSAPPYFSSFKGRCDGGLVVNSPVMPVIRQLVATYGKGILDRVKILSVGTGYCPTFLQSSSEFFGEEGLSDWLREGRAIRMLFQLNKDRDHDMASVLLGQDNFYRLDFPFDKLVDMIDTSPETFEIMRSAIEKLDMTECFEWLERSFLH